MATQRTAAISSQGLWRQQSWGQSPAEEEAVSILTKPSEIAVIITSPAAQLKPMKPADQGGCDGAREAQREVLPSPAPHCALLAQSSAFPSNYATPDSVQILTQTPPLQSSP